MSFIVACIWVIGLMDLPIDKEERRFERFYRLVWLVVKSWRVWLVGFSQKARRGL